MPYDNDFYQSYSDYLEERSIRTIHDRMFNLFLNISSSSIPDVVDFGAGLGEFYNHFFRHTIGQYTPVDLNNPNNLSNFVLGDYTNINLERFAKKQAFVSLFSTECCLAPDEKYKFYDSLFEKIPNLRSGLVSGFFYNNRKSEQIVKESGDIDSYQTIEEASNYIRDSYFEMRIHVAAPSKLFGSDVIEVWKFFKRW